MPRLRRVPQGTTGSIPTPARPNGPRPRATTRSTAPPAWRRRPPSRPRLSAPPPRSLRAASGWSGAAARSRTRSTTRYFGLASPLRRLFVASPLASPPRTSRRVRRAGQSRPRKSFRTPLPWKVSVPNLQPSLAGKTRHRSSISNSPAASVVTRANHHQLATQGHLIPTTIPLPPLPYDYTFHAGVVVESARAQMRVRVPG